MAFRLGGSWSLLEAQRENQVRDARNSSDSPEEAEWREERGRCGTLTQRPHGHPEVGRQDLRH